MINEIQNKNITKRCLTAKPETKKRIFRDMDLYDDIEKKDIEIKDKERELKRIKTSTLKDFVYSNKNIPNQWKNNKKYQYDVMKIFNDDPNFLIYIGNGTNPQIKEKEITNTNTNANIKTKENKLIRNFNGLTSNKTITERLSENNSDIISNKEKAKSFRFNQKKLYTDKEINYILDEYREAYSINDAFNEMYPTNNNILENKNLKNKDEFYLATMYIKNLENEKKKKIELEHKINKYSVIQKNYNSSKGFKRKKLQRTFKENIYSYLVPNFKSLSKIENLFNQKQNQITFSNKKINKNILNENELYNKEIKIKSPLVGKNLESIRFFGPYFSHCPLCQKKNLNFYNELNQNQALNLIQYIKTKRALSAIPNK